MGNLSVILTDFRRTSGKSQREFAEMLGIPQTTWSGYESGKSTPKMAVLLALAEKGFNIKGLTTNLMEEFPEEAQEEAQERIELTKEGAFPKDMLAASAGQYLDYISNVNLFKFSHEKPIMIPTDEADPNAMAMIPVYSQRAAAGPGQPPTQLEEIETFFPIILAMLGGSNPRNCGAVRVVGDSMTDMTLFDGDLVVFDKSRIEGDGVYVISIGGDVRIKRLEYRVFDKKIIIRSENQKRYPDPEIISFEQAQEMLMIHGKVISWVHRHPY